MNEKNCKDCFFCTVKLLAKRTPRELAEGDFKLFDDTRVVKISCDLQFWNRDFSSMRVFNDSNFGATAAAHCGFYSGDDEIAGEEE